MDPVSNVPALVAVCGWVWSFVHVTVAPTGTCRSAGSNLKSPIDTAFAAVVEPAVAAVVVETAVAGAVATALGVVVGAGAVVDDVESLLQPATASNNSVQ